MGSVYFRFGRNTGTGLKCCPCQKKRNLCATATQVVTAVGNPLVDEPFFCGVAPPSDFCSHWQDRDYVCDVEDITATGCYYRYEDPGRTTDCGELQGLFNSFQVEVEFFYSEPTDEWFLTVRLIVIASAIANPHIIRYEFGVAIDPDAGSWVVPFAQVQQFGACTADHPPTVTVTLV